MAQSFYLHNLYSPLLGNKFSQLLFFWRCQFFMPGLEEYFHQLQKSVFQWRHCFIVLCIVSNKISTFICYLFSHVHIVFLPFALSLVYNNFSIIYFCCCCLCIYQAWGVNFLVYECNLLVSLSIHLRNFWPLVLQICFVLRSLFEYHQYINTLICFVSHWVSLPLFPLSLLPLGSSDLITCHFSSRSLSLSFAISNC